MNQTEEIFRNSVVNISSGEEVDSILKEMNCAEQEYIQRAGDATEQIVSFAAMPISF